MSGPECADFPECFIGEKHSRKIERQVQNIVCDAGAAICRAPETKKHPKVLSGGTPPAGALTHAVLFQLLTQRAAVDAHQIGGAGLITAGIFHYFFQ